jgi:hypothetical protein
VDKNNAYANRARLWVRKVEQIPVPWPDLAAAVLRREERDAMAVSVYVEGGMGWFWFRQRDDYIARLSNFETAQVGARMRCWRERLTIMIFSGAGYDVSAKDKALT